MHHLSKLKNGISLITVPVSGTKASTILCMFPVGSRYETKALSGASHFVEHMLFKGTERRPDATDISRVLEAAGADYNAFTNKDYTGYYVKIDGSKQEIAFDLLSDMLYHSKIEKVEVEREKGPIVEELRMHKDNPLMEIDDLFEELAFGNCPLGWNIGGTEKTVRGISRADLWDYYQTHYSPKNMVLVVAGAVDTKRMKKLVNYFVGKQAPANAKPLAFYKNGFIPFNWTKKKLSLRERLVVVEKKVDQAQVILGFPGLPNNHPERFAASIMLNILGAGMSSRLFVEVREKRGLAYMVRSGSTNYRDAGLAYVQAGLDPARLPEAFTVIKAELHRISHEPVTAAELRDAKSSLEGRLALNLEDSSAQAEWYSKQFMFGREIETPDDVVKKLKKVTVQDVQKVAARLFNMELMRVAVVGNLSKEKVLRLMNEK